MIDFTYIQTAPIPPNIASLQRSNVNLQETNKLFRNIFIVLAVGSAIIIGYKIYKKEKEENERSLRKRV